MMDEQLNIVVPGQSMDASDLASLGGKSAAANMTPEQRQERAKKGCGCKMGHGLPHATHGSPETGRS